MDDQTTHEPVNEPEDSSSKRRARRGDAWVGGIMLIFLGLVILMNNAGVFVIANWWAVFILIPAIGSFGEAWRKYQEAGRLNSEARGALIAGLLIATVGFAFLFDVDWKYLWPVLMIGGGLMFLVNVFLPE